MNAGPLACGGDHGDDARGDIYPGGVDVCDGDDKLRT